MIRTKIEKDEDSESRNFPRMAKSKNTDKIVLFTSEKSGLVLISDGHHDVGHWDANWINFYNKDYWEPLPIGTKVSIEQVC